MEPAGALHEADSTVSAAFGSSGAVSFRVPTGRNAPRFVIDWQILDIAFLRRDAEAPLVDDHRNPVAGDIEWRGCLRSRGCSGWTAGAATLPALRLSPALCSEMRLKSERQQCC